eukprot:CAMPEP_0195509812 /NCGR_PEP_ID=MMETSP0794_2-20130614/2643_1 /TAXON_ID=515487 /ORGANISM="Stephanopyxis turris, Strain CCMP 815" /LENGTH=125 /DNA_ID=CAMNT_0040637117 /DNA_START=81 /DNA_END=454 /DNA_ORIENTATION=+
MIFLRGFSPVLLLVLSLSDGFYNARIPWITRTDLRMGYLDDLSSNENLKTSSSSEEISGYNSNEKQYPDNLIPKNSPTNDSIADKAFGLITSSIDPTEDDVSAAILESSEILDAPASIIDGDEGT